MREVSCKATCLLHLVHVRGLMMGEEEEEEEGRQ